MIFIWKGVGGFQHLRKIPHYNFEIEYNIACIYSKDYILCIVRLLLVLLVSLVPLRVTINDLSLAPSGLLRGLQKWRRNFTRKLTIPGPFPPYSLYPYVTPYIRRRIMATVNKNMFGASITEPPEGAQLMALPLNLIAEIVSHVRGSSAHRISTYLTCRRSTTQATLPGYVEHVGSSIIWRCRSYTGA